MKINQRAFTLLEIIFASLVFGIVILGVVTSNIALQKSSKNSSDAYYVIQNTNFSLRDILNKAVSAVGTPSSPGYAGATASPIDVGKDYKGNDLFAPYTGDANTFCFYEGTIPYAVDHISNAGDPVPVLNSGPWFCYTVDNYKIYRCEEATTNPQNTPVFVSCTPANLTANLISNIQLIGTAKTLTQSFELNTCSATNTACVSTQKALFSVAIENCADPSSASCTPGNPNYPYMIKSGNISPAAQSAG